VSAVAVVASSVVVAVPVWAYTSQSSQTVIVKPASKPTFKSATTRCPAGQNVLFGGYRNGVAGMRRTADNLWTVDGFNLGNGSLRLTSYAYCGKRPAAARYTKRAVVTSYGTATVKCPAGKVVLAGGFATSPKTVFAVQRMSRIANNQWQVAGYLRYGITKRTELKAIAYCGKGPAPTAVSSTVHMSDDGGRAKATCPSGKKLVFGGMVAQGAKPRTVLVFLMRVEEKNSWMVANSTAGTLTSIAYCR
jgi:hypothetical protein